MFTNNFLKQFYSINIYPYVSALYDRFGAWNQYFPLFRRNNFLKLFLLYSVLKTPLTLVTQGEKCGSVSCSVLGCPGLAKTVMLQFSQNLWKWSPSDFAQWYNVLFQLFHWYCFHDLEHICTRSHSYQSQNWKLINCIFQEVLIQSDSD